MPILFDCSRYSRPTTSPLTIPWQRPGVCTHLGAWVAASERPGPPAPAAVEPDGGREQVLPLAWPLARPKFARAGCGSEPQPQGLRSVTRRRALAELATLPAPEPAAAPAAALVASREEPVRASALPNSGPARGRELVVSFAERVLKTSNHRPPVCSSQSPVHGRAIFPSKGLN